MARGSGRHSPGSMPRGVGVKNQDPWWASRWLRCRSVPNQIRSMPSAAEMIQLLDLKPHPEGGHFRQTWRCSRLVEGDRAASTAIYFLLGRGERSHWHRVDAAEGWHHYAGAPLRLEIAAGDRGPIDHVMLGTDFLAGERPQAIVPARAWQAAESLGEW